MSFGRRVASLTAALLIASCGNAAEPIDPTSTTGPITTQPATTTSSSSSVVDEAEGSGCTPGPSQLEDGEWFGYVLASTDTDVAFDLACWFTGEAAIRAAAEDGEESPPPNDYYIRNINETLRTLDVSADTEVVWYPEPGDPSSEATIGYSGWVTAIEDREFGTMVWLIVEDGRVVTIREQWVP